jgi:hypothetical protein
MKQIKPRYRKRDHPSYFIWEGVRGRVGKAKNYKNVTLAPEWDDCDVFADWCDQQVGFNQIDDKGNYFQLDKDIFSPFDKKSYSPATCCFVPASINMLFTYTGKGQGKIFDGMTFNNFSQTFQVNVSTETGVKAIGNFYTELDAFYCLKEFRQGKLKYLAEKYRDKLDDRVYDLLISYDPEYPYSKEVASKPLRLCVEHERNFGYDCTPIIPKRSLLFYEDGRDWRNNSNPYMRSEDVLL